jgi:EmrB/QacA subfamily drug resistance transporter
MAPPAASHDLGTEDVVTDARRRTLILAAVCIGLVAVVASVSGLNVAQAALAEDLGADQSDLLWIINGYTVALAALLMPIGAIGDRWGRKKVLVTGLILFIAANLAGAVSGDVTQLFASRLVAGLAAALIMPATLSIITASFPTEARDQAIGIWAGFAGAGGILGLVGSAVVVDNFSWPWVFAIPVALAAASLALSVGYVPHSREHTGAAFDVVGSILSATAVGALVLGIHEGPEAGWTAPITLAGLVVAVVALVAFVAWELRFPSPLMDVRLFKHRLLTAGSINLMVVFAIMIGLFLVVVQFLQAVLGYSALLSSVCLLPMAATMMPLSTVSPKLASRFGMRTMFVTGLLLIAGGLGLLASLASTSGYLSILPGLVVMGAGAGIAMTPGTAAITAALPVEKQGVASALNDTVRELGGAVGIALIGSVLGAAYSANVAGATAGLPPEAASAVEGGIGGALAVTGQMGEAGTSILVSAQDAFLDAFSTSLWLCTALAVAAAVFVAVWTPGRSTSEATEPAVDPDRAIEGLATATATADT